MKQVCVPILEKYPFPSPRHIVCPTLRSCPDAGEMHHADVGDDSRGLLDLGGGGA